MALLLGCRCAVVPMLHLRARGFAPATRAGRPGVVIPGSKLAASPKTALAAGASERSREIWTGRVPVAFFRPDRWEKRACRPRHPCVINNAPSHKTTLICNWFARRPRWRRRYTPTLASWINQGGRFFGRSPSGRSNAAHTVPAKLTDAITAYIVARSADPRPFR